MLNNLSFRSKLGLVVLPPLALLLVLSVLVVRPRVSDATEASTSRRSAEVARRSMSIVDGMQAERGLSGWVVAAPDRDATALLKAARSEVDDALTDFNRYLTDGAGDVADQEAVQQSVAALDKLNGLRAEVERSSLDAGTVFEQYTAMISSLIELCNRLVAGSSDATLVAEGRGITEFLAAKEELAKLRGTIVRRLATDSLSIEDYGFIQAREAAEAAHVESFRGGATARVVDQLEQIENSEPVRNSDRVIDLVREAASSGKPVELRPVDWWSAITAEITSLDALDDQNFAEFSALSADIASSRRNQAIVFAAATVAAVLLTMTAALMLGRSLARRLASIAEQARIISTERLPEVLEALRNPTPEALAAALPQVQADAGDEIGTMAQAFNNVLRTSVETSIDHSQQRARTVTNMLLNLGRRNQALIDRQLEIMDDLESRHHDPELLEGLFKVDHLVTRMRRNAENLVVLAGEQQARSWSGAVPVLDILRGASSEVADLSRVEISVPASDDVDVSGPHAVTLSHLLAELVENAVAYSPPSTVVKLSTDRSRGMLRVWVVDKGVGMEDAELAEANRRLSSPPDIDALTTDRVGFQVVGRLARQLGVLVQLQANPGGGLAAAVLLPNSLFDLPRRDGGATESNAARRSRATTATDAAEGLDELDELDVLGAADEVPVAPSRVLPAAGEAPERTTARPTEPSVPRPARPAPIRSRDGLPVRVPAERGGEPLDAAADDDVVIDLRDHDGNGSSNGLGAPDRSSNGDAERASNGNGNGSGEAGNGDAAGNGSGGAPTVEPLVTADGLVKRRPGGALAGNARAAAAEAGAFRRLPIPGTVEGDTSELGGRRRFANLSRLQQAVTAAREDDQSDTAPQHAAPQQERDERP